MSDDDWQAYFCSLLDAHLLFGEMTQQHILPIPGMAAFTIIIIAGVGAGSGILVERPCLPCYYLLKSVSNVSRELTPRDPKIVPDLSGLSLDQMANSCSQLLALNPPSGFSALHSLCSPFSTHQVAGFWTQTQQYQI